MSNILIVEPSSAGLKLIPTAKTMGLYVIVFSANQDERIIPDYYRKDIDQLFFLDTYDMALLQETTNTINRTYPLSAIIPGSEYHVPIAAKLSNNMGLPGISPQQAKYLRVKSDMRECLSNHNLRCPRYAVIASNEDILKAIENVSFPCVIKPIASAGSVHVSRANNIDELLTAYHLMCMDTWSELGQGIGNIALIEEYIQGEEFSVEGYVDSHGAHIISITKKILSPEPYFVEMGHIVPANIHDPARMAIQAYVHAVIKAFDISVGIFHCELKIDQQGPILIEMAGRLAGDRICDLILLSSGINLYQIMLRSYLGQSIHCDSILPKQYAGIRFFALNNKNTYSNIYGITELQAMPGFQEFTPIIKPGQKIPPLCNFMGRIAACIFTSTSYDQLVSILDNAQNIISFS